MVSSVAPSILFIFQWVDLCSDIYRSIGMYVYEHGMLGDLVSGVTGTVVTP